jgi:multiple antibiotic resistance protein
MTTLVLFAKFFVLAFSALVPVANPPGSALVFLGLVGDIPEDSLKHLARRIAIATTLFLGTVELVGTGILTFFGISLPVVQVAGGLVLASMGWNLLNQPDTAPDAEKREAGQDFRSLEQQVFYPLTFPVTVGPGCIVIMVTLSAHAVVRQGLIPDLSAHAGILTAVMALSLLMYVTYAYASRVTKRISPSTAHGILRIVAFVLLCIGVQITWNGLETLIRALMKG